jgi:hypothetical protein
MRPSTFIGIVSSLSVALAAFDLNRGGGVLKAPPGDHFTTVTGTFLVPNLSGTSRLSIWVGIGDSLEQDYVLGGGINYNSTLQSFSAYWPGSAMDITAMVPVASGNSITITINAADAGGTVTVENTTQNQTSTQSMSAPAGVESSKLTALAANWFVQAYQVVPGELVQVPNFGTISFTACKATTKSGVSVPISSAGRYEIQGTSGQVSIGISSTDNLLIACRCTQLRLSRTPVFLSKDRHREMGRKSEVRTWTESSITGSWSVNFVKFSRSHG